MALFKKAAVLTDVHFGRSGNSTQACEDNLAFLSWFCEEAKRRGCDVCLFLGDWFDNRHAIQVSTLNAALDGMDLLNSKFAKTFWLPGNHDLFYRDRRDISSIQIARHHKNIEIVHDPLVTEECLLLPWLVGDEAKSIKTKRERYVFGHLEVPGFLMNARVEMPASASAIDVGRLDVEAIFSGHFHPRQRKGKVIYTGNIMPFNFGDAWDDDRGAMFLDWGGEPVFEAWPEQPVFRTTKLSEMLEDPDRVLLPRANVRATVDLDMEEHEIATLRESLMHDYGLRRLDFLPLPKEDHTPNQAISDHQTVDQIVIEGLLQVESAGLDPKRLVDIYRSLAEIEA